LILKDKQKIKKKGNPRSGPLSWHFERTKRRRHQPGGLRVDRRIGSVSRFPVGVFAALGARSSRPRRPPPPVRRDAAGTIILRIVCTPPLKLGARIIGPVWRHAIAPVPSRAHGFTQPFWS